MHRTGPNRWQNPSPACAAAGINTLVFKVCRGSEKLSDQSDPDLQRYLRLDLIGFGIRIYSDDKGMSFGLDKCGQMVSKRGKMIRTEGIDLPEGNIGDIQDSQLSVDLVNLIGQMAAEPRTCCSGEQS